MEKKSKILIIVIAIAAIAIPSTFFGIQFFIGSQINNAELTVEDIELLSLSDDQMIADVEFGVTTTSPIAVSFRLHNISITYDNAILGNVSLSKNEYTTADTVYQTTVTINITNSGLYLKLTEDFINETSLNLGVSGTVEFTGALSSLPSQSFSKEISINGLDQLSPTIQAINFENATEDTLELEIIANLNNPSQLTANLSHVWIDIYYSSSYVGNASATNVAFVSGTNQINLDAEFGGSKTVLSEILSNYIKGVNSSLTLTTNITINFEGGSSNFDVENTILFEFEGTDIELISVDDVDISIDITFSGTYTEGGFTGADIDITVDITVHNPMSFIINITSFDGELYFDDNDVSSIVISFVTVAGPYDPDDNIYIDNATITDTIELPGSGSNNGEALIDINNDIELGTRLYDECYNDDELYIDIIDGIMDLQIGGFSITITNIDIYDIYVPQSSLSLTLP